MKKRILSVVLAAAMLLVLAIPASAATLSGSGTYNGFLYMTTDSCYTDRYYCVIEANSADYLIKTDVTWYVYDHNNHRHDPMGTDNGTSAYMVSTNSGSSEMYEISQIYCAYIVGGVQAGHGFIPAN